MITVPTGPFVSLQILYGTLPSLLKNNGSNKGRRDKSEETPVFEFSRSQIVKSLCQFPDKSDFSCGYEFYKGS